MTRAGAINTAPQTVTDRPIKKSKKIKLHQWNGNS